jgi:hypothetical protein
MQFIHTTITDRYSHISIYQNSLFIKIYEIAEICDNSCDPLGGQVKRARSSGEVSDLNASEMAEGERRIGSKGPKKRERKAEKERMQRRAKQPNGSAQREGLGGWRTAPQPVRVASNALADVNLGAVA